MRRLMTHAFTIATIALMARPSAAETVATFNENPLPAGGSFSGPAPGGTVVDGPYGPVVTGTFQSGGAGFRNNYDTTYGSWSGFAYSNVDDTSSGGWTNQFASFTGVGHTPVGPGQVDNYGIAFGYRDLKTNGTGNAPFNPANTDHLLGLPTFTVPVGLNIAGLYVSNTTYAALSMLNGDSFAKKFGGDSGDDKDWFKVSAYGIGADGKALSTSVDFYLADYRFDDNSLDYVVGDWRFMDLSTLAGAVSISFNVSSSDVGSYGLNSPGYFALDDVTFISPVAVPEPATLAMSAIAALVLVPLALRRKSA